METKCLLFCWYTCARTLYLYGWEGDLGGGEAAHNDKGCFCELCPWSCVILPLENMLSICFASNTNECRKNTRVSLFVLCRGGRAVERRRLPSLINCRP